MSPREMAQAAHPWAGVLTQASRHMHRDTAAALRQGRLELPDAVRAPRTFVVHAFMDPAMVKPAWDAPRRALRRLLPMRP